MSGPIVPVLPNQTSASIVFRRALTRAIIYPVLLLVILIIIFLGQLSNVLSMNERVQHSNEVITQSSVVLKQLVDMETGLRGYLMTKDSPFLDPYENAQTTFDANFERLKTLAADNDSQVSSLQTLESNITSWREFAARTLIFETTGKGVSDVETQLKGKALMDTIREELAAFVESEDHLRNERIRVTQTTSQIVIASVIIAGLTVGGLLVAATRQQLIRLSQSYEQAMGVSLQQAEEASNQREWLRGVLSSIGEAVITADMHGNVTFLNQVSESLTGWSAQDAVGKPLTEVYKVAYKELQDANTAASSSQDPLLSVIKAKQLSARDGKEIAIEESASSIKDVRGGLMGHVIVFRDVTRRKAIEQERLRLIETQAHYANMLRRSNDHLQQFAYVASHDLQEPLRMVVSYLQLIERRYAEALDDDARDFIGYAVDGANRMKELITGLLAYARVDKGEQDLRELTSLQSTLDKALNNLSVTIAESGAVITHDDLPEIQADSLQMMQLFQNLIGNALKFHMDAPLHIHIGAQRHGEEWQFSVQDNGIGIEAASLEKIFGLFQRLHRRSEYSGTGIGLAICRKVVERHEGRIWVESEVGKGSTFYFTLPIKRLGGALDSASA
jgi:PAS domain S-box-containing protein